MDFEREAAKDWYLPGYGPPSNSEASPSGGSSNEASTGRQAPNPTPVRPAHSQQTVQPGQRGQPSQRGRPAQRVQSVQRALPVQRAQSVQRGQPARRGQSVQPAQRFQLAQPSTGNKASSIWSQPGTSSQRGNQTVTRQSDRSRSNNRPPRGRSSGPAPNHSRAPANVDVNQQNHDTAKRRWLNNEEADDVMTLPERFFRLTIATMQDGANKNSNRSRNSNQLTARSVIYREVGQRTGVFIKPAEYGFDNIVLWGNPIAIPEAKQLLLTQVQQIMSTSPTRPPLPALRRTTPIKFYVPPAWLLDFRREPPPSIDVQNRVVFIWKDDGPSLKRCFGEELEEFDILRIKYRFYIYALPEHDNTLTICAGHKFNTEATTELCRMLWKEKNARIRLHLVRFMVQPPQINQTSDQVIIQKPHGPHQPILSAGASLPPGTKPRAYRDWRGAALASNFSSVREGIEYAVKITKFCDSCSQMTLRVKFGTFIIDRWKVLLGCSTNSAQYPLDNFWKTLQENEWQGRVVPGLKGLSQDNLFMRCMQAGDFLEPMNKTSTLASLGSIKASFSARFEFPQPVNGPPMPRLDVMLSEEGGAIETETVQHYWLKPPAKRTTPESLLELYMIEFERADWQIDLHLLEPIPEELVSDEQRKFANGVKLEPYYRGSAITARPGKKIVFDPDVSVTKFIQKSAFQLKVKDTDFVLELARYEEFRSSTSHVTGWAPPVVRWGATLLNPHWDQVLRDIDMLDRGIQWHMLFLGSQYAGNTSNDPAFQQFLEVIQKVADFLGPVPRPGEEPPTKEEDFTRGVLDAEFGTLF